MSGLNWGLRTKNGEMLASVFCSECREVIERDVKPGEAGIIAKTKHHSCTWLHDWNGERTRPYNNQG